MKRSFLVTAGMVAVLALCATTTMAQATFINDDFASASGANAPGWSIITLFGVPFGTGGNGDWTFTNPGGRAFGAPLSAPYASCDGDHRGSGQASYSTALVSGQHDTSSAGVVLLDFDYHLYLGASSATIEAYDGSTWNVVDNLTDNWNAPVSMAQTVQYDITSMVGASTKAQIRFVYTANWDWWWAVDNVLMFEPAMVSDVGCSAILSPNVGAFTCIASLSATESVTLEYTNYGTTPINPGDLVSIAVDYDLVNVLNEADSPVVPITPGGTNIYTTLGTIDMSALGSHTIDVHCTIMADVDPSNDSSSKSFTLPGSVPVGFGYIENFDSLTINSGNLVNEPVPAGWENAQDDTASTGGHPSPDWGATDGGLPSNTAMGGDHTSGSGLFMYIEDSSGQSGAGFIELRSPCLDTSGAVGSPTVTFWNASNEIPGSLFDNVLEIDIINETTGGTVTSSFMTIPGDGTNPASGTGTPSPGDNAAWRKISMDLSAFAPDLVKVQFRITNNINGSSGYFDDEGLDDFAFFDAILPTGQAPQPGNAVFDVNGAINGLGNNVASGQNGPYSSSITAGGNMDMTWSGQNNGIVICLFGPQNEAIATFPGVGQLDIGALPLDGFGVPSLLFVFGDGGSLFPAGPLFNSFFFTGPAGVGGVNFEVPLFAPGFLARFQCVMNPAGMFYISNAVDVSVF